MDENKKLTNRITEGNTKLDGDVASIRNVEEELENKVTTYLWIWNLCL